MASSTSAGTSRPFCCDTIRDPSNRLRCISRRELDSRCDKGSIHRDTSSSSPERSNRSRKIGEIERGHRFTS